MYVNQFFMILSSFSIMPIKDQVNEIRLNGEFVTHFLKGVYTVSLFQLNGYYVQLYFHLPKLRVEQVNCFDFNDKLLLPYLKKFSLIS